jgi:hypothetical protein
VFTRGPHRLEREPDLAPGARAAGCIAVLGGLSASAEEFLHSETNVLRNLSQQRGGDVTTGMKQNGRAPAVGVSILPMRASPPDLDKTAGFEQGRNLPRLVDGG